MTVTTHPSGMDRAIPFMSRCQLFLARRAVYGQRNMSDVEVLAKYKPHANFHGLSVARIDQAIADFTERAP